MTRALSWNMTFFRDPESIKGTGCQGQIMPRESHRSSISTYIYQWHIYSLVSVNSISRFTAKPPIKQRYHGMGLPRAEQSSLSHARLQRSDDQVKAENKIKDSKLERILKCDSKMWQNVRNQKISFVLNSMNVFISPLINNCMKQWIAFSWPSIMDLEK